MPRALTLEEIQTHVQAAGYELPPELASVATTTDGKRRLDVSDVADVASVVDEAGPPTWLVEGLWPADAYGVTGAEDKAGKTWAGLDLAVSVATGTPWLNRFACPPGPVVAFLGEGGPRAMIRRLRAIITHRGGELSDLEGLRLCFSTPRLRVSADVAEVREELERTAPRAVLLDPLYLAASGAKGSDLYQMADVFGPIQEVCQEAGCALVVTTHWNKTGEGSGPQRFTGVGPGAWGRVLASAAVERKTTDNDGSSNVLLRWEFQGSEIPELTFRMRRRVRAEDPTDLASPLVYSVEVTDEGAEAAEEDGLSRTARRVRAVLGGPQEVLSVREIGDRIAGDGHGPALKTRTIERSLNRLAERGEADSDNPGKGHAQLWWTP